MALMFSKKSILKHLETLRSLDNESNYTLIAKDPFVQYVLHLLNAGISAPAYQWDYWHLITKEGGVRPFSVGILIRIVEEEVQE